MVLVLEWNTVGLGFYCYGTRSNCHAQLPGRWPDNLGDDFSISTWSSCDTPILSSLCPGTG